jgi:hypothetical protein
MRYEFYKMLQKQRVMPCGNGIPLRYSTPKSWGVSLLLGDALAARRDLGQLAKVSETRRHVDSRRENVANWWWQSPFKSACTLHKY